MSIGGDDSIKALREALRFSPDNVPLRQHLAETLLAYGRIDEAEQAFREGISLAPASEALKLGLARVYSQQSKHSQAMVILEELSRGVGRPTPQVRIMLARTLAKTGDLDRAAHHYREAVEQDPSLVDQHLAEELGTPARPVPPGIDLDGEDVDDRLRHSNSGEDVGARRVEIERPKVTFADVGGMDGVKEEIRLKIIYPLQRPELYKAYGKAIGGGILMYGPPGCGKTHLARATAGEVKARFIAVGIADVLNMYIGASERNLAELFEQARANTPCILFFDEVDALGGSRADLRQSAGRQLVNQFLNELDGVNTSNEGVLVLAATNAPWHIDSAFRRPGRFDRIIFVPPPDESARASISRIMATGKPTDQLDHEAIAKKTDGFSGADMKALVDVAVEGKLQEALRTGKPEPLRTKDLLAAAKNVRPTAREWFSTAKNHALYANQSGLYDPVLEHLKIK